MQEILLIKQPFICIVKIEEKTIDEIILYVEDLDDFDQPLIYFDFFKKLTQNKIFA